MALIKCHECGGQVSSTATACPACGATVATAKNKVGAALRYIWYVLCAGVLAIVFVSCYNASGALSRITS